MLLPLACTVKCLAKFMWHNPGGFSVSIKTDLQHCTALEVTVLGNMQSQSH